MTPTTLAVLFTALAGCAARPAPPSRATPAPAHHGAGLEGPAVRALELPAASGSEPREVRVLVDEPGLKLAAIALRAGTVLPPHHADVPVTIHALQGAGTVIAGAQRLRVDAAHGVVLAAGVEHAVEPDANSDLLLIVHHLGRAHEQH